MHGWRHTDGVCASHHTVVCIAWRKPPHKYANIFGGEKSKYAHMATHPSSAAVMNSLGRGGVGHARQNWLSLTIQPLDDWPGVEEWIWLWKFFESAFVRDLKSAQISGWCKLREIWAMGSSVSVEIAEKLSKKFKSRQRMKESESKQRWEQID